MKARFIGDPRHDGEGPEQITCFGLAFVKGEWREVPDGMPKIAGHSHFEIEQSAAAEPVPERVSDLDAPASAPVKRKAKR